MKQSNSLKFLEMHMASGHSIKNAAKYNEFYIL
jgi:hypothetical protein